MKNSLQSREKGVKMEYTEFSGKTVEDALQKGLDQLGLTRETAEWEVVEEGKKGLADIY